MEQVDTSANDVVCGTGNRSKGWARIAWLEQGFDGNNRT